MDTLTMNVLKFPPLYKIGTKIYVVKRNEDKFFKDKCPLCDDTGEIEVRGVKCKCPACKSRTVIDNADAVRDDILICHFKALDYIINSFHLEASDSKSDYEKQNASAVPRIKDIKAFRKYNNSWSSLEWIRVPEETYMIDPDMETIKRYAKFKDVSDYIFTTKKKADVVAAEMNNTMRAKLEEFNKVHGTSFDYPWN